MAGIIGAMVGGSLLVGVLGSFDLGPGMLVVAAFIGWVVALAVVWAMPVRPARRGWLRPVIAALLAAGSIAGGLIVLWGWALVEGGVLGPVAYADARFGLLAPLLVLAAAAVAAVRAR
jgi:FtsH-binding integral membrane protein